MRIKNALIWWVIDKQTGQKVISKQIYIFDNILKMLDFEMTMIDQCYIQQDKYNTKLKYNSIWGYVHVR